MNLFVCLLFAFLYNAQTSDSFVGLTVVCDGWFCDNQHVDMVSFSYNSPTPVKVQTVYASAPYAKINSLNLLSCYDGSNSTYYALVQDPAAKLATLWSYNVPQNQVAKTAVQYGATGITFDSSAKAVLAIYGGDVWQVSPSNGARKYYFQLYDTAKSPALHTSGVSAAPTFNFPNLNVMVQQGNANIMGSDACFYIYTVTQAKSVAVSDCYPNAEADDSLGIFTTNFIYQTPSNPVSSNFFSVNYNILGPSYDFVTPSNFSVVNEIADFQDFAAMGWVFTGDATSYTWNPVNQVIWGSYYLSSNNNEPILGGVLTTNDNVDTYVISMSKTVTNIQVVWSESDLKKSQ